MPRSMGESYGTSEPGRNWFLGTRDTRVFRIYLGPGEQLHLRHFHSQYPQTANTSPRVAMESCAFTGLNDNNGIKRRQGSRLTPDTEWRGRVHQAAARWLFTAIGTVLRIEK